ncbi:hypothetical protein ABZ816_23420 [Actinosynnema sp. NPDC047251]|uniref:hypothetical protein n=1 Tax=Saccharothrix espanaensis TaxID=103731 RepID=UPI0002FAC636|nr:hypothetical protein [Saccharothrix espanaensis]
MDPDDRVDAQDGVDPEEFAEDVGIDPTPQEVDQYLELAVETPQSESDESGE